MTEEKTPVLNDELKARLKDQNIWIHFLHLILYGVAFFLLTWILLGMVVLHFALRLLTGEPNPELQKFGKSLSVYMAQIIQFASFNSELKPFPLSEWPSANNTKSTTNTSTASHEEE